MRPEDDANVALLLLWVQQQWQATPVHCVLPLDFQTLESKKRGAVVQRDQGGQECEGPDLP